MKRKELLRRASAAGLAAIVAVGTSACQQTKKETGAPTEAVTEAAATDAAQVETEARETEAAAETETAAEAVAAAEETAGEAAEGAKTDADGAAASRYQVTEENQNKELVMNDQPESSYWFPEQLLEWNAEEDKDLEYNVSTVPLAKRVDKENLTPVNSTQNTDTKVMAISIMNSSTSGNAPHGLNSANCNIFTYWQYVDELVYWGGSSGEGLIVPPSPDVTDLGHKNGVPVIGTVFFPQGVAGGKMEWLNTFLAQAEDGSFPMADKLIEVAQTYGFDGWFINQETEGTEEEPLTKEHADAMQLFIKYFKEKAPELRLVYYDSMTVDGEMDWQNALTDANAAYLVDGEGNAVADEMFLNFWWTDEELADDKLLEASAEKAAQLAIDPYDLYAGIDIQANGYNTPIRWDLFANEDGTSHTSLGIYCPSWAYFSASTLDDFHKNENTLWVNSKRDPSVDVEYTSADQWHGVATYVVEKSAITELPFITNFNTGSGYSFYKEGEQISTLDWNNRSIGDILPTYRWMIDQEENNLTAAFDVGNAWYGGTSLKLYGKTAAGASSVIHMYSADLPVEEATVFTTTVKTDAETDLNAILTFDDGTTETVNGDAKAGEGWTTIGFDISGYAGKKIREISYEIIPATENSFYQINFGNITITNETEKENAEISNLTVDGTEFDEDGMYAGVRLSWESNLEDSNYEVYRVNSDGTISLLGVSNTTCFYVNTLPRMDETNKSEFMVIPVNELLTEGEGVTVSMDWPDNSLPKAGLTASQTLVGTGSTVTFTSNCSQNTESVAWSMPGASEETAEGETVSVTYENEGVYDVTVTAKNSSGEEEKTYSGLIVVSAELEKDGALTLLSQGKEVEATAYVNDNEAPPFAVDGDVTKKWCATGTPPHELTIDLGEEAAVSQVKICHAEAGGESADMNTKAYTILVSSDGLSFNEVASVTKNTKGETLDTFAPVNARYVKLSVVKPTQGSDTAARIYEVEVYGTETTLDAVSETE